MARGVAAFLGAFSLLNILGSFWQSGFDASHWWIVLPGVPTFISRGLLFAGALLLLAFAVRPVMKVWRRRTTVAWIATLLCVALANSAIVLTLAGQNAIATGTPFPLSLLIATGLAFVLWQTAVSSGAKPAKIDRLVIAITLGLCTLAFPLSQMIFFGKTDYRREADAAVVFGARAYADGRPSDALTDRVRTACELYLDGTVPKLIFSGGPGDGEIHETESMRRMAISLGVPDGDILLDPHGLNTEATVIHTRAMFEKNEFDRILAVSHAFHLPRIKMTYQRHGINVYTVPARETYFLRQMPYLMARETAAWWVYYLRPLHRREEFPVAADVRRRTEA